MASIVNVLTDVGILALPIRYILPLQLTLARRIQVLGIFLLGSVVCVFGIVRVVVLARAPKADPSCKYRFILNITYLTDFVDRQSGMVRHMVFLRNRHWHCSCLPSDPCSTGYQIALF